jgi:hypothetical protein
MISTARAGRHIFEASNTAIAMSQTFNPTITRLAAQTERHVPNYTFTPKGRK